ncbi:hypothetical protein [Natronococcus jeotgali]|nr:hypothetical protein [Natronococcus jeotgali]
MTGRPTCPRCDEPIVSVTVLGPSEAIVAPCGHTMPAAALPELGDDVE